jgi:hypothetical protein
MMMFIMKKRQWEINFFVFLLFIASCIVLLPSSVFSQTPISFDQTLSGTISSPFAHFFRSSENFNVLYFGDLYDSSIFGQS